MFFDELNLSDNILDALYDMNFEECTPIQERCIPEILKGNDVLGIAQTGTGKTAAYLLPILSLLDQGGFPKDAVNCIIMAPTRELAQQIGKRCHLWWKRRKQIRPRAEIASFGGGHHHCYTRTIDFASEYGQFRHQKDIVFRS